MGHRDLEHGLKHDVNEYERCVGEYARMYTAFNGNTTVTRIQREGRVEVDSGVQLSMDVAIHVEVGVVWRWVWRLW